jgi:hypothetical protein
MNSFQLQFPPTGNALPQSSLPEKALEIYLPTKQFLMTKTPDTCAVVRQRTYHLCELSIVSGRELDVHRACSLIKVLTLWQ